jgi:hypothetical protein
MPDVRAVLGAHPDDDLAHPFVTARQLEAAVVDVLPEELHAQAGMGPERRVQQGLDVEDAADDADEVLATARQGRGDRAIPVDRRQDLGHRLVVDGDGRDDEVAGVPGRLHEQAWHEGANVYPGGQRRERSRQAAEPDKAVLRALSRRDDHERGRGIHARAGVGSHLGDERGELIPRHHLRVAEGLDGGVPALDVQAPVPLGPLPVGGVRVGGR